MYLILLCLSFLCDLEKVRLPSSAALAELQVAGIFTLHSGQNKMENIYFWANKLEETLHQIPSLFWERFSSLYSLNAQNIVSRGVFIGSWYMSPDLNPRLYYIF